MRCVDVNVLVDAFRDDSPSHAAVRPWLDAARRAREPLGLCGAVASGFVRIVTHPRIFQVPTPTAEALAFIERLSAGPAVVAVAPGARHWGVFAQLCTTVRARGNLVADCYLAALALELGSTWVTSNRDFARFVDLRIELPRL